MTDAEGRPPVRAGLTLDRVVEAAFEVLDSGGIDKLSTRAIAARLDVSMNTVMWHIETKGRLIDLMGEAMVASVDLDDLDGSWTQQAQELIGRLRQALLRHRDGATVAAGTFPAMPATLAFSNKLISLLLNLHPTTRSAAWTAWNLFYFTLGLVQEEQNVPTGLHQRVRDAIDPQRFPAITAVLTEFVSVDYDARFAFGIQQILRPTTD